MKKIFITAISWDPTRSEVLQEALASAKQKYSNLVIVVGYSAIALKIASIASIAGLSVQMMAPDIDVITGEHITMVNGITVISTTSAEYSSSVTKDGSFGISGVMAFDDGDPIVLKAMGNGTKVWFPLTGKVV